MSSEVDLLSSSAAAPRGEKPNEKPNVLRVVAACAVVAVLLEAGTLVGAPTLTPLNPVHWRLKRMAFFFACALAVYAFWRLTRDDEAPGPVALARAWWGRSDVPRRALALAAVLAGVPCCLAALALAATNLVGWGHDLRALLVAVGCALSLGLLVAFRERVARRLELGFLILSLTFGTLMCACMPVVAEVSWDGQIHFNNTQAVSYVLDAQYTEADLMMTRADAVVALGLLDEGDLSAVWHPSQDARAVASAQDQLVELSEQGTVHVTEGATRADGASWVGASSIGYVPAAAGLWIGRLLRLSCLGQYFLARLASVVAYSAVFFLTVRRLRSGKTIVAALGLLPTPLLMAANFSYDPWCFALVTYSFARYVSVLQGGRPFRRCDAVAVYGAFFLGALVKAVIFPLLFVFFLAPRASFGSRRSERAFRLGAVLTAALLLASFALPFISSGASGGDTRGGSDVSSAGQVAHILSDPLGYLGVLAGFAAAYFNPLNFSSAADMLANALSVFPYLAEPWSPSAQVLAVVEWALVIAAVVVDRSGTDAPYRGAVPKVAALVGLVGAFVLISTALYVSFTPVGLDTISGVQHRYLLPLLPCALLVLANFGNGPRLGEHARAWAFLGVEWGALCLVMASMFVAAF